MSATSIMLVMMWLVVTSWGETKVAMVLCPPSNALLSKERGNFFNSLAKTNDRGSFLVIILEPTL